MNTQTNYVVFQCYGQEAIFHECTFALLSLSRCYNGGWPADTEIWIYTDNEAWFESLGITGVPLRYRKIDQPLTSKWRGTIDFVHRVKIEVLRDFTRERQGNILYADTDVVFTRPLEPLMKSIGQGNLLMHVMESVVSNRTNPIMAKLDTHLKDATPMQVKGKPIWDLPMWNAGVLGFHTRYRPILEEVLLFTDTEYPKFPKHIIEQFAFSVFFANEGTIKTTASSILHYWNLKEARTVLASYFNYFNGASWPELVKYSDLVQMHVLMQEKVNFFQNRDITDKLLKKQWLPMDYNWKELVQQL